MKKNLVKKLKKTVFVGIVGASALLGSGCAYYMDSRCRQEEYHIPVKSNKDHFGGASIELINSENEVQFRGSTPCIITVYKNGKKRSNLVTPSYSGVGDYTIVARSPEGYPEVIPIPVKTSPWVWGDLPFAPISLILEAALGRGQYHSEKEICINFADSSKYKKTILIPPKLKEPEKAPTYGDYLRVKKSD